MRQEVTLQFSDGRPAVKELRTFMAPVDQVAFERHYEVSMTVMEEPRAEHILWMVWRAYERENGASGEAFEDFLEALEEYDLPEGAEAPDPTGEPPQG